MTTKFVQSGHVFDHPNGATAIASGDTVIIGTKVGIALTDIAANATGSVQTTGVFNVPKLGTDVIAIGVVCYWDATNKRITTTSSGNTQAGIAFRAAGNGATVVDLLLNGIPE